jgi:CRP-like cAMP-binding protein
MTASFSSNELAALLARSAWFRSAPAAMQAQLIQAGRIERLAAGERLFTRGDSDDGLYCVLDGLVRIGAASSAGKEALLAVIEPVNWFGEIALFDNRPRTHDAYAERDSELFHVPRAALAAQATLTWLASGIGLFVIGWVFQFVGHVAYEHRKPAFVDDVIGLLIGPLFVLAEALFGFGWRPALREAIEAQVGATRINADRAAVHR